MFFQEDIVGTKNLSGKPVNIKQHNQKLVISLLEKKEILSAGELTSLTGLSKTTVSKILAELCKQGIVCSAGKGESTAEGGKKPELFQIHADFAATVVLSMYNKGVLDCAVIDLGLNIIYREKYTLNEDCDYSELIAVMKRALIIVQDSGALAGKHVCGVAVAHNGAVNRNRGEILYPAQSARASFYPICSDLMGVLPADVPVDIHNFCHYAGCAELLFECNENYEKLAVISCNETVNGCLLENQQMLSGSGGIAGVIGHLIVDPKSSTRCYCGCRGCIESLISERAVAEMAKELSFSFPFSPVARQTQEHGVDMEALMRSAMEKEMFAEAVFAPVIENLVLLIHSISCLIDVPKVIIQGVYARAGEEFLNLIREKLHAYNKLSLHSEPEVEFSQYSMKGEEEDELACLYGAGYAVANTFLGAWIGRLADG